MCGISGFISTKLNKDDLFEITCKLSHRGPDADGYFYAHHNNYNIGLGHRRLSIIDLSEASNQPMQSHDGRYMMIFNGEVYNYQEIRQSKFANTSWRSSGDGEVVLECFAKYGAQSFEWLNGMFALAIWDKEEKILTLARDHVGIKPLIYYLGEDEIIFGSELKAITSVKRGLDLNREIIPAYLHVGYIPHPFTIYKEVRKLGAGSFAQVAFLENGNINYHEEPFWKLGDKIAERVVNDEERAKKQLDTLLRDSVQKQLISDVPIGTFLSGGTDSSLVTALATRVSNSRIKTFSIAVTDGKINEAPFAEAVAKHLGTEHHELPINQQQILEMVPDFMKVYDEPFTDSSAFPTMLVSKLAREHVTVVLSGDGGDELFWGYGYYEWARRLQSPLLKTAAPLFYAGSKMLGSRYKRIGMLFEKHKSAYDKSHNFSQNQYFFSEKELQGLLVNPGFDFTELNYDFHGRKLGAVEQMSFWDFENYLKDDLLVKVDRASMFYSLETRVPLLDYRVVEFAANLAPNLKRNSKGVMKYLLKEVLYDYVPKDLLDRPKWGFSIPLVKWLKKDLKWLIDKFCSKDAIESAGLVRYEVVQRLIKLYQGGGHDYLYNRIWSLVVLHWFIHEYQKESSLHHV